MDTPWGGLCSCFPLANCLILFVFSCDESLCLPISAKIIVYESIKRFGFVAILLAASIPNPVRLPTPLVSPFVVSDVGRT